MVGFCAVKDCKSGRSGQNNEGLKFFTFPKNLEIRKLWIQACGKNKVNFKSGTICSVHFTPEDWNRQDRLINTPIEKRKLLDENAVPSQLVHAKVEESSRAKRSSKRSNRKLVEEALEDFNTRFVQLYIIKIIFKLFNL